jgi:hypothetical protein
MGAEVLLVSQLKVREEHVLDPWQLFELHFQILRQLHKVEVDFLNAWLHIDHSNILRLYLNFLPPHSR